MCVRRCVYDESGGSFLLLKNTSDKLLIRRYSNIKKEGESLSQWTMKLMCKVEVNNRLMSASNGSVHRNKPQRTCLAIGRNSVKDNEPYVLLQTANNKQGTKYKARLSTKINWKKCTVCVINALSKIARIFFSPRGRVMKLWKKIPLHELLHSLVRENCRNFY